MEIPASSAPNDFGASLRIAREGRGLTLQQIAEATKISIGVLQALEQNDIARLPGSVYNRSFVRTYAREVGLDPAATVDAFLDAFPEQRRPDENEKPRDEPGGRERVVSQQGIDRTVVSLALIIVSVFGLLLFFGLRESRDTDVDSPVPFAQEVEVAPMEPSREPSSEAPAGPQPPSATLLPATPPPPVTEAATIFGPLTIDIYATGPCWVSLTVDGQRVFARVLHLGEREVYEARDQIILKVGDAGVFDFSINQQPGRSLGARGEVVTVEINRANYRSFLTG